MHRFRKKVPSLHKSLKAMISNLEKYLPERKQLNLKGLALNRKVWRPLRNFHVQRPSMDFHPPQHLQQRIANSNRQSVAEDSIRNRRPKHERVLLRLEGVVAPFSYCMSPRMLCLESKRLPCARCSPTYCNFYSRFKDRMVSNISREARPIEAGTLVAYTSHKKNYFRFIWVLPNRMMRSNCPKVHYGANDWLQMKTG